MMVVGTIVNDQIMIRRKKWAGLSSNVMSRCATNEVTFGVNAANVDRHLPVDRRERETFKLIKKNDPFNPIYLSLDDKLFISVIHFYRYL